MLRSTNLHRGLNDPDLDFHSKGILTYLALIADKQKSHKEELQRSTKTSYTTLKNSFSKLENQGYVKRVKGSNQKVEYKFIQQIPSNVNVAEVS